MGSYVGFKYIYHRVMHKQYIHSMEIFQITVRDEYIEFSKVFSNIKVMWGWGRDYRKSVSDIFIYSSRTNYTKLLYMHHKYCTQYIISNP